MTRSFAFSLFALLSIQAAALETSMKARARSIQPAKLNVSSHRQVAQQAQGPHGMHRWNGSRAFITNQPTSTVTNSKNTFLQVHDIAADWQTLQDRCRAFLTSALTLQLPPLLVIVVATILLLRGAPGPEAKTVRQLLELLIAATVFFASASLLIFLNKNIMVQHHFHHACFVGNLGVLGTTIFSQVMVRCNLWEVDKIRPEGTLRTVILPQAIFGCMAMYAGNAVYLYLPVYLVQVLKANTLLLVMLFTMLFRLEHISWARFGVVLLICFSMVIVSAKRFPNLSSWRVDLSRTVVWGLLINFTSNCGEALRVTAQQMAMIKMPFKDCLYHIYPFLLLVNGLVVLAVEGRGVLAAPMEPVFLGKLLGSAVLGCMTSVSGWWLTKLIGALSVKIMGYVRNFMVVLAAIFWRGEVMTAMDSFGYTISLIGIFLYMHVTAGRPATEPKAESR
mmetsp:Transcript_73657/g.134676  ORF Transcript_73657/g.134676 Transcript_73657/m.134676 type:complete len:449 (-) Transcript_73657:108-1454(-)